MSPGRREPPAEAIGSESPAIETLVARELKRSTTISLLSVGCSGPGRRPAAAFAGVARGS